MTETRDIRAVIDAAEQAAAVGDYASAEQLLTEVAVLQGASLGPLHPDLANTLNNLGVVCEILEKPQRAERHFRRAYEIAKATLEPDHPFLATSRKNLEDFCNTRGIPVDTPPSEPEASAEIEMPASLRAMPSEPEPPPIPPPPVAYDDVPAIDAGDLPIETPSYEDKTPLYPASRPAVSRHWSWPVAIAALVAGALVVTLIATAPWRGEPAADAPKQVAVEPQKPLAAEPPPPVAAAPRARDAAPTPPSVTPAPPVPPPDAPPPTPAAKSRPARTAPSEPPTLVAAQLCQTLSTGGNWNCVPPGDPVSPSTLFFYSRVKSATDTTVQHRWYRGDHLRQSVELRIRANPAGGYRTYSRQTVDGQSASDWRVELRTSEGVLLHEERFVVR
jgi:Protein of unknown function (DUF2914)/Tetratricopeptide repeat